MLNPSSVSPALVTWNNEGWTRKLWAKVSCALFGHKVNNFVFESNGSPVRHCRCGVEYLGLQEETRVSHTVSCFLLGHRYIRIAERDGHHEYVCNPCGHPLLFRVDNDPYAAHTKFKKKVRYLCNLFGHRVHYVAARNGLHEYACDCGHSFLKEEPGRDEVKHPPICLFAGHYLRFTERRNRHDEFRCRNCGHTFYFAISQ